MKQRNDFTQSLKISSSKRYCATNAKEKLEEIKRNHKEHEERSQR